MPEKYEALRIHVQTATGEVYPIVARGSGDTTYRGSIPLEFVKGLDADHWLERGLRDAAFLRRLGSQLFDALFSDQVLAGFISRRAAAEARGHGLRLMLTLDPPELVRLPWELIYAEDYGFVARSAATPLVRHLSTLQPARPPVPGIALRVLVTLAEPEDYVPLGSARQEARTIVETLSGGRVPVRVEDASAHAPFTRFRRRAANALRVLAGKGERVQVDVLEHVTRSGLKNALREAERGRRGYHLLHFIGHGTSDERGGYLLFEDENRHGDLVPAEHVAEMLDDTSVNMVFLNACASAREGESDRPFYPFRGVAQACINKGILAALAMQIEVLDRAAATFSREFYAALVDGEEVEKAVLDARHLMAQGQSADWVIPVLYSRVSEGPILVHELADPPETLWERFKASVVVLGVKQVVAFVFSLLSALALLLGLVGNIGQARQPGGLFYPVWPAATATATPVPPMADGFNVAVGRFSTLDATGSLTVTEDSRALSDWLYRAISDERDRLPAALAFGLRGPDEVEPVPGVGRDDRAKNARQIADQHNATILIYGLITGGEDGYRVEPEFYVSDAAFGYGSEVAGPDRLGQAVPYNPPLDDPEKFAINEKLFARNQALRYLLAGLAYYYLDRYDEAWAQFRQSSLVEHWQPEEGKEVVYLLMGAARLIQYDTQTADERYLGEALDAFAEAYRLNPDYARSYLGLGGVALVQAVDDEENGLDEEKLGEARGWYLASLDAADQPATAYVPARAYFGLAQVYLKGYEHGLPGWSAEEARVYLERVVEAYERERAPDLIWFAGRAHALLGRLAGDAEDWAGMSAACQDAIQLLDALPGRSQRSKIAEYWTWVADAEEKDGHIEAAREAYWQAIQIGQGTVPRQKLESWQNELERLEEGGL